MAVLRPDGVYAITLFVEDLAAAKAFYGAVFDLPVHVETADSAVYAFGGTMVNLLEVGQADELVGPAPVAGPDAGVRFQLTVAVDDVDAAAAEAVARGAVLLNGPMDRPWGIRTAAFRDPAGHVWELGPSH